MWSQHNKTMHALPPTPRISSIFAVVLSLKDHFVLSGFIKILIRHTEVQGCKRTNCAELRGELIHVHASVSAKGKDRNDACN